MKTNRIILTILTLLLATPALALAGAYVGSIQGFNCVTQGKVCPVGRDDPMVGAEQVFVLLTEGTKYYFVPNLDRGIMARHFNEEVKIEGAKSDKFNSIKATDLYVRENGKWKKAWSQDRQDRIYYEIMSGHPLDGS